LLNGDYRERWGKGDYLASFPQIYGEVGCRNLSVKIGKFYTPLEGGAIMSTNRFFYSTAHVHHILPITQTGVLANWDVNSRLSVYGSWTAGEDFFRAKGYGASTFAKADNNAALLGFRYKVNKRVRFEYGVLIGKEDNFWHTKGTVRQTYAVHKLTVGIQPNRNWDYTFTFVSRNNNRTPEDAALALNTVSAFISYGINQELIYKWNRHWAFGLRGEWMYENEKGCGVPHNHYEVTLGVNWTPSDWLVVRPEIRYDYTDYYDEWGFRCFKNATKADQFGFGISTVVKF